METLRKFLIADLSIRKIFNSANNNAYGSAIINLRDVCTKLYFNLIFTMQTYKELIKIKSCLRIQPFLPLVLYFSSVFTSLYSPFFFLSLLLSNFMHPLYLSLLVFLSLPPSTHHYLSSSRFISVHRLSLPLSTFL